MTDEIQDRDSSGAATPAESPGDDALDDLRRRIAHIEGLELSERVAAIEQVNDGLVRALGELDDL